MIFTPLQYDSGKVKELLVKDGEDITKGDALEFDDGLVKKATSVAVSYFVALESITNAVAANNDSILALYVDGVEFEATTSHNTDQATQVGFIADIDANGVLDNDSLDGDAFLITKVVGPAADMKVRGYFLDRINS